MLPLKQRIRKKKDFDIIFKTGKSAFNEILGLKSLKNEYGFNRFGFIVSAKVSKKAVDRNKVKRRLRQLARNEDKSLKKGFDFIFLAQAKAKNLKFQDLEKAMHQVFSRLNLYK